MQAGPQQRKSLVAPPPACQPQSVQYAATSCVIPGLTFLLSTHSPIPA